MENSTNKTILTTITLFSVVVFSCFHDHHSEFEHLEKVILKWEHRSDGFLSPDDYLKMMKELDSADGSLMNESVQDSLSPTENMKRKDLLKRLHFLSAKQVQSFTQQPTHQNN